MYQTNNSDDLNLFYQFKLVLSLFTSFASFFTGIITLSLIRDKIKEKTSGAVSALHYGGGK